MTINALSLITAQSNRKPYKFDIPNSLRFRNNLDSYSSSSYFHKVFSTTQTDKTKWTISYWWKGVYNSGIIPGSLPTYNTNYYGFLCLSGTNGGTTTIADTSWLLAKTYACSLKGIVIFAPKPFLEKKLCACVSKCSSESGSIILY